MPTLPVIPTHAHRECLGSCEAVDWLLEQSALRAVVLRKVVAALHRTHDGTESVSWQNCTHEKCVLTHQALEGLVERGQPNRWGYRQTVVPLTQEEPS